MTLNRISKFGEVRFKLRFKLRHRIRIRGELWKRGSEDQWCTQVPSCGELWRWEGDSWSRCGILWVTSEDVFLQSSSGDYIVLDVICARRNMLDTLFLFSGSVLQTTCATGSSINTSRTCTPLWWCDTWTWWSRPSLSPSTEALKESAGNQ